MEAGSPGTKCGATADAAWMTAMAAPAHSATSISDDSVSLPLVSAWSQRSNICETGQSTSAARIRTPSAMTVARRMKCIVTNLPELHLLILGGPST